MPKLNDYRREPDPPPVRPPTLPPDFPTSRKTPAPSCSRLLKRSRQLTRLPLGRHLDCLKLQRTGRRTS